MAQFQLGSISTGTLRTDDLLEATATTLNNLGSTVTTDIHTWEYDDEMLLSIYMDELQELCPPFIYFGTLEGDGADFGFWPDRDAIQEAIDPTSCLVRINANGDYVLEDDGVIVQVSDHGNVTVMDMERNVIWSVV